MYSLWSRTSLGGASLAILDSATTTSRTLTCSSSSTGVEQLVGALQALDTAALCDADKKLRAAANDGGTVNVNNNNNNNNDGTYKGIRLLPHLQRLATQNATVMAGTVRTVKLTQTNDFLGVIQGVIEAQTGEVLLVDASHSNLAVAGELLAAEAQRLQLGGLVILNGCMRDSAGLAQLSHFTCFAGGVTPYAGTCMYPAEMQCVLNYSLENIEIRPGDIVVGDQDGILVATADTLTQILPVAQEIHATEAVIRSRQGEGKSLSSMCNIKEHLRKRLQGQESHFRFEI